MSLNSDRRLYSHLYIASQSWKGDLDSFFSDENHSYPVSIFQIRLFEMFGHANRASL